MDLQQKLGNIKPRLSLALGQTPVRAITSNASGFSSTSLPFDILRFDFLPCLLRSTHTNKQKMRSYILFCCLAGLVAARSLAVQPRDDLDFTATTGPICCGHGTQDPNNLCKNAGLFAYCVSLFFHSCSSTIRRWVSGQVQYLGAFGWSWSNHH